MIVTRSDTGGKIAVRRTGSTNPFETINELRRIIEEQDEHIASLEEDYAELKMKFKKQSEIKISDRSGCRMSSLIDKGKVVDKISDLFLDKYEAKANSDLTEFYKGVLKILINEKGQPWISVKDGLPENDGKYLVCGKVALSNIHGEPIRLVRFTERKEWLTSLSVTHWMPLPQKPESEDDTE